MPDWIATRARKASHLRIAMEHDAELDCPCGAGFDQVQFIPNALPEIDLVDVDTSTSIFGRRLKAPLVISSMTGGTGLSGELNRILAQAAQTHRIAMGLGSGRVLLENPRLLPTFNVRPYAPDVLLFANLGAVQLNQGISADACRQLVDDLSADGLILHLNPVHEALEPDGDTAFHDLLPKIAAVAAVLKRPVIVKEVGFGLAPDVVRRLVDAGVAAVDVAGSGGTAWAHIEQVRAREPWRAEIASDLAGWGVPTPIAIRAARAAAPRAVIVGSGGVRSGLDVAKALALGADLAGIARPFLSAANQGAEATDRYIKRLVEGLRIVMFGIGASSITALRTTHRLAIGRSSLLGQEG